MNSPIQSLGYLGLNVTDAGAWHGLLTGVFAVEARESTREGLRQYRMDTQYQRLSLYAAGADGIAHVGWETRDADSLHTLGESLAEAGIDTRTLTDQDCNERGVMGAITFEDPVMGVCNEVYYGALVESTPFTPARAMGGYVTGDQGMGHVVLMTDHQDEAVAFYREQLGFEVSDIMDFGGEQWGGNFRHVFLHCNSRHHSLAIMSPPAGGGHGDLNHFALTVRDFDDLGYAYDIVRDQQVPVVMTLGRHVNDLATSFYVANPSRSAIEMTWGGLEVGEDWVVKRYDDTRIWGHHLFLPPRPLP